MIKQIVLRCLCALLLLLGGLPWIPTVAACSMRDLDGLIADAVATSGKYWIASLLIGELVMFIEAYHRRWSITLALTIGLLIFHPHLTVRPFPMPSCEFTSVQASQAVLAVLAVLVVMLGYRIVKIFLAHRKTAQGASG